MFPVSSLPSTVPSITSFESGVGPTVTLSPSWNCRTDPWMWISARQSYG